MENGKFVTNVFISFAIVCYVVLLGFTPLLHDHGHDCRHEHENDPEHESSESSHSEESCVVCVFINTHVEFRIQPTAIVLPYPCSGKPSPSKVVFVALTPTTNIQSRAPPVFPNPFYL